MPVVVERSTVIAGGRLRAIFRAAAEASACFHYRGEDRRPITSDFEPTPDLSRRRPSTSAYLIDEALKAGGDDQTRAYRDDAVQSRGRVRFGVRGTGPDLKRLGVGVRESELDCIQSSIHGREAWPSRYGLRERNGCLE